jgi:hypothetical protein
VDPWDETIEPDWFVMPIPPRTSRFSCSRVELPLLRHSWLLICSCVACYLARALACGIEPSRSLVEHSRSYEPSLLLRRTTLALSASARAMVCSHLATSKFSTNSSQCRLISSTAFSSTVFDVFHPRSRCSRANSFAAAVLLLLPHRVCSPCMPLQHPPNGVLHP